MKELQREIEATGMGIRVAPMPLFEVKYGGVHPVLFSKDGIGMLIWNAYNTAVKPTRWCITIASETIIHTVLCLCGCQQRVDTNFNQLKCVQDLDAYLRDHGIVKCLVRGVVLAERNEFYTEFLEAGSKEGLASIQDWPIKVIDRHAGIIHRYV